MLIEQAEKQTILIVDDDPTTRMVAAAHLRQQGYAVALAENGAVFLDVFQEVSPDLILLDVDMPVLDGFSACRQLRRMHDGKTVPVLMMTGLEGDNSIEEAYDAGATDFIAKPVNWTLLQQRLKFMLRAVIAMSNLIESEARLAKAQSIARLDYWRWDLLQEKMIISETLATRFQLNVKNISAHQLISRVVEIDRPRIAQILQRSNDPKSIPTDFEVTLKGADGTGKHEIFRVQSELEIDSQGVIVAIEGTLQDITDKKEAEAQIQFLSRFDRLTGLQNRESFTRVMYGLINECIRRDGEIALVLIDIDRFVRINDIYGHRTGDEVLLKVSRRIVAFVEQLRQDEGELRSEVCRWGGDKFSLAICNSSSQHYSDDVFARLLTYISAPLRVNGHEVSLTSSIGYARAKDTGLDLGVLLRNAENAIRHAKSQGRNVVRCYDESMLEVSERRLTLEVELHKALPRNQFTLHYQPRISAITKHIVGAEALLRWHHPELGEISPVEFIPVLEEMGLIHEVGAWVMEAGCRQLKAWHDSGFNDFVMSVNLSAVQFRDIRLAQEINEVIVRTGITPKYLEFELTETAIMEDVAQTQATLSVLKGIGVQLAVDDFGTGYSSLGYLRSFPLDTLKVDRTFVRELPGNSSDRSLTSAIIAMARSLKLHVVAEGIETEAQAKFLLEKQCDEFQGFLFSRPIDSKAFDTLLKNNKPLG
ncbi:EAL domain-containing protein [Neptunomonas sp.]|uniref:putative bifunctional diguanylate cyclase/phosphodiesterase n=1 Tax=Neptunomonas sp. TaxID=1971898 RepID=UPI0025E223DF|nr:EAL domain-containing protein [Neptunomonas sp.]